MFLMLAAPSCSIKKLAINSLANTLSRGSDAFTSDDDPELIREAMPFALKTIEALLLEAPGHDGLSLAACRGFAQYAYAFIELDAEIIEPDDFRRARELRGRALRLYLRARDHGLDALDAAHPGLRDRLRTEPWEALSTTSADEVPLLFWTGAAWGAAISLGKDRPELMADADAARALVRRALELDEDYDRGAIHQAMIVLEALPEVMGGSMERAREHFERAVELSGGLRAGPYVTFAETVCVSTQDHGEFRRMIDLALAVDPEADRPERLVNLISQKRARVLAGREEELFWELDVTGDGEGEEP